MPHLLYLLSYFSKNNQSTNDVGTHAMVSLAIKFPILMKLKNFPIALQNILHVIAIIYTMKTHCPRVVI